MSRRGGTMKNFGPGKCLVCGSDFVRRSRVNVCCTYECSRVWKNTRRNDIRRSLGGGLENQNVSIAGRTQHSSTAPRCSSPLHEGDRFLPEDRFYTWTARSSGKFCRSGWCRGCLKRWIAENDWSDAHGQSMEADDQARLELCESRDTYEMDDGVDALALAMKLVKEVS